MKKLEIQSGKEFYYFIVLDNLLNILSLKFLFWKELIDFIDVVDKDILKVRDKFVLDDMVLFYFFLNNFFDGRVC